MKNQPRSSDASENEAVQSKKFISVQLKSEWNCMSLDICVTRKFLSNKFWNLKRKLNFRQIFSTLRAHNRSLIEAVDFIHLLNVSIEKRKR